MSSGHFERNYFNCMWLMLMAKSLLDLNLNRRSDSMDVPELRAPATMSVLPTQVLHLDTIGTSSTHICKVEICLPYPAIALYAVSV